jgi:histidinol-phosphate phosphatase family protein
MSAQRAIFLDRDGTLIVDVGYPRDPAMVVILPGVSDALRPLQRDWLLVIVSNQSGIGRGVISPEEANAVHDRMISLFAQQGIAFAGVYYCPHAPGAHCECRKPSPGMLLDAALDLDLDLERSIMIGDKASDVEAGRNAGCAEMIRLGGDVDAVGGTRCTDWGAVANVIRAR